MCDLATIILPGHTFATSMHGDAFDTNVSGNHNTACGTGLLRYAMQASGIFNIAIFNSY